MATILKYEPDPGGQICGYQIQIGSWHNSGQQFCGEPKAPGLYYCREHHDDVLATYGEIRMAPGNTKGR